MKLLLDENLPKRLKSDFPEHEIYTVRDKGWNSKKNGELLELMLAENFDVLLTFDQNLEHQQNFDKYPISVFVLIAENNTYLVLRGLVENIKSELEKPLHKGATKIKRQTE
jgi:predicted nuclease of predicted toxin-antitoxin system